MDFFDDFFFLVKKLLTAICAVVFVIIICSSVLSLLGITDCTKKEEALRECYMQNPRTADCEYMVWKYEVDHAKPKKNITPMPIFIR